MSCAFHCKLFRLNVIVLVVAILSACTSPLLKEYRLEQQVAERELPSLYQASKERDCSNVMFRFRNGLKFTEGDAAVVMECLDIQMSINERRWTVTGRIQSEELALKKGYENYMAIFHHITTGDLLLDRARDLYFYVERKSWEAAQSEINHSNALVARAEANYRLELERQNQQREVYLQSLMKAWQVQQPVIDVQPPRTTTTDCKWVVDTWSCTSW